MGFTIVKSVLRHSVRREPQAMLACDKQRTDASASCESLMHSGYRLYRGGLCQETLMRPFTKRTDISREP